jgi:hypothetical protein
VTSAVITFCDIIFLSQIVAGFADTGRAITETGGSLDWARCLTIVSNERTFEFEADSEEQAILWVQVTKVGHLLGESHALMQMLTQLLECHKMKRSPW